MKISLPKRGFENRNFSNPSVSMIGSVLCRTCRRRSLQPSPATPPSGIPSGRRRDLRLASMPSSCPRTDAFCAWSSTGQTFSSVVAGMYVMKIRKTPLMRTTPKGLGAGTSDLYFSSYCKVVYSVKSFMYRTALTTVFESHLKTILLRGNGLFQRISLLCITLSRHSERLDSEDTPVGAQSAKSFFTCSDKGKRIVAVSDELKSERMSSSAAADLFLGGEVIAVSDAERKELAGQRRRPELLQTERRTRGSFSGSTHPGRSNRVVQGKF